MKKLLFISLLILVLVGCSSSHKKSSEESQPWHNYNVEMLKKALVHHPDFPNLQPDEKPVEREDIIYSSKFDIIPHQQDVSDKQIEREVTSASYFITLIKEQGNDTSYWKYQYFPLNDEVILVDLD
ncbi:hypothetical protein P9B03_18720 [Metasolibacillus meyeri]|uniref:Lipoprotein n=1 Tax=Metasolibacillus meyeri TaxID=1071052 RepID=A0AAW9NRZ0_9BACL|nr:hypothetical protein [Metasolibacillus meyeri]MEC1180502.1 hypothetical protein [Metasolibacillus meyeri]